jgi:hypothetical protein
MVQSLHIRQAKMEEGSGAYQPQEKLEEAGSMPAGEMAATELPQEEAEQQFCEETTELESTAEWPLSATKVNKDSMGDQVDRPTDKEEKLQQGGLHTKSQPWDRLDEEIEGIRRLMLRSAAETASEEKLSREEPAIAAGQHIQQQQRSSGADGQIQRTVWDTGGF